MTISAPKAPSTAVLQDILREMLPKYSFKLFGVKSDSILIGKSPFVGAQVSRRGNDITIQGTPPTFLAGALVFILSLAGFATFTSAFRNLEKEIASSLHQKFA